MTASGRAPDTLFGGTLVIHQPARGEGYRVNVDAVLLAWFAGQERRSKEAVDLGAGVGAVGLCLLSRDRVAHVTLVDNDRAASSLARRNIEVNGWDDRAGVVPADVAALPSSLAKSADLVVCNPPYVEATRGSVPRVAVAARTGDVGSFVRAARQVVAPRGRVCFIYPAGELATLLGELRASGLEPKRLCFVHATEDRPARVALVEAKPAKRGGLIIAPAVTEYIGGVRSTAMNAMLSAPTCSRDRAPA